MILVILIYKLSILGEVILQAGYMKIGMGVLVKRYQLNQRIMEDTLLQ